MVLETLVLMVSVYLPVLMVLVYLSVLMVSVYLPVSVGLSYIVIDQSFLQLWLYHVLIYGNRINARNKRIFLAAIYIRQPYPKTRVVRLSTP
jgi:hypothetical protein